MKKSNVVRFAKRKSPRRKNGGGRQARSAKRHLEAVRPLHVLILLVIGAIALLAFWHGPAIRNGFASGDSIAAGNITVIDGDTIRVAGMDRSVRLVGYNAPETQNPGCTAEAEFGARATRRLREIIQRDLLTLALVACSCRSGTEGTSACNHGRACGVLRSGGRDVGNILISEKLAAPFRCRFTSCPPTPRPWCGGL